jgi:hypothetical protein
VDNDCDEDIDQCGLENNDEIERCQEGEEGNLETREIPIAEHQLVEEEPNTGFVSSGWS